MILLCARSRVISKRVHISRPVVAHSKWSLQLGEVGVFLFLSLYHVSRTYRQWTKRLQIMTRSDKLYCVITTLELLTSRREIIHKYDYIPLDPKLCPVLDRSEYCIQQQYIVSLYYFHHLLASSDSLLLSMNNTTLLALWSAFIYSKY